MIDDRQIVMIITTSVAVLVGCALVVFLRRSGGKKAVELPKPPVVKIQTEAEADDGKMKLTIFFGTQTGMAEGFAKDEYAADDDEYGEKLKKETLALFFLASYRDGVPTDNAARFYKWFTKEKESGNWLKNLQFGVFGLGNCPYEHFNEVAIC